MLPTNPSPAKHCFALSLLLKPTRTPSLVQFAFQLSSSPSKKLGPFHQNRFFTRELDEVRQVATSAGLFLDVT